MKVIIAGCRNCFDYELLTNTIKSFEKQYGVITEVISGAAVGVDQMGEKWAKQNNIPFKRFAAQWNKYGRRAGPIRNEEMSKYGDKLIALWDGESRGTKDMIKRMENKDKDVFVGNILNL